MNKLIYLISIFLVSIGMSNLAAADCDIDESQTEVRRDTAGGFVLDDRVVKAEIQVDLADCEDNNPTNSILYRLTLTKDFGGGIKFTYRDGHAQLPAENNVKHTFHQIFLQTAQTGDHMYEVCLIYRNENGTEVTADCDSVDLGLD